MLQCIGSMIVSQVAAYFRAWHKQYADPMDNYRECTDRCHVPYG